MMVLNSNDKRKSRDSCLFCEWANDLERFRGSEDGKSRWITKNKRFIAVLDRYPKVTGHTLVISKIHYNDITEVTDSETKDCLGHILVKVSKLLKKGLNAGKIYIMSMCEHWEQDEIDPQWKKKGTQKTTEHFHIHLLPRYGDMRRKEIAQENMFVRPQDYGCTLEALDIVRSKIIRKSGK